MIEKARSSPQENEKQPFFKQYSDYLIGEVQVRLKHEQETDTGRNPILCRACGNEITDSEYSTIVDSRHEHSFVNPSGIPYRIGCFSDAYGCVIHGIPTYEFTWFAGFSWSYCSCADCFTQLGWHYQSGSRSFFGLILDNLMRNIKTH